MSLWILRTTPARLSTWRIDRAYERVALWSDVPSRALMIPPTSFRQGLAAVTGVAAPRLVLRLGDGGLTVER